jgi:hypothetical protein
MKKMGIMTSMSRVRLVLSATTLLVFSLGIGASLLSSVEAQTVSPSAASGPAIDYNPDNRTLSVHLNGLPLDQVMEELSKQTHIRFRPPPPAQTFDSRPVTAVFERMPIERAIKQLLGPSNTAMLYGTARQSGGGQPRLMEVRVLDLGVIPVLATSEAPSTSPIIRMSPEALEARREEIQKRREERQARSNNRRGGAGRHGKSNSTNQAASQDSSNTSSEQTGGQSGGGQSSGNGGNGSNTSGGQPSESGAKPNGSGGGKQ